MNLKTLLQAAGAVTAAGVVLAPAASQSQTKGKTWKQIEADKAAAAKDQAGAAKAQADAAKVQAEAATRQAEIAAQAQREAQAADARKAEAERAWAADPTNPANVKIKADEVKAASSTKQGYIMPAVTLAVAAVGIAAGAMIGRKFGASATAAVTDATSRLGRLGADAAKLNKTPGVLAASVKGDQMRGIVDAGLKTKALAEATPAALKAGDVLTYATAAQGAVFGVGSVFVEDPALKAAMRIEAAASLGASVGMKSMLAIAKGNLPKVSPQLMAKIDAGKYRLARETRDGADKISKFKVGAEVSKASGDAAVAAAKATGAGQAAQAEVARAARRPARVQQTASGPTTFTRTYKTGPKAGTTETVTRR